MIACPDAQKLPVKTSNFCRQVSIQEYKYRVFDISSDEEISIDRRKAFLENQLRIPKYWNFHRMPTSRIVRATQKLSITSVFEFHWSTTLRTHSFQVNIFRII